MFPKMMQGPIVRYEQVARQLMDRRTTPRAAFEGAQRFIIGLAKKVLLADYAGKVVASLSTGGGNGTFVGAWLAALMFMFPDLFRFLRLFRYGHWPWPHLRLPLLREL